MFTERALSSKIIRSRISPKSANVPQARRYHDHVSAQDASLFDTLKSRKYHTSPDARLLLLLCSAARQQQWGSAATATHMHLMGAAGALGWAESTYSGSQVSSNTIDSSMDTTSSSGEEGGAPLRRYSSSTAAVALAWVGPDDTLFARSESENRLPVGVRRVARRTICLRLQTGRTAVLCCGRRFRTVVSEQRQQS